MAKQGYYGKEYVKTKDGDYDYQGQVDRLHNLVQWDRQCSPIQAAPASISLDEMQERWKAYDWLIASDKHFESSVIKKVDEINERKRNGPKCITGKSLYGHISKLSKLSSRW